MEKEDLIEYKKKLSLLTEKEKKERIKYLKRISNGEIFGPITGYSSVDKQWFSHYSDEAIELLINFEDKNETMYETLSAYANNNSEKIAFEYLGNKVTYGELMDNIDATAGALKYFGVGNNDVVTLLLPNMPETRYLIYACSKIGAISNPVMPTVSTGDLSTIIKNSNTKCVFMMTDLDAGINKTLEDNGIDCSRRIEISPLRSSNGIFSVINAVRQFGKKSQYDDFLGNGCGVFTEVVSKCSSDIALIEQTGGTTGLTTKSVMITNGNVLASNYQLENGEFDFNQGDSLLDILLPSISYGAAFEHLTLCNGIKNFMIPILVKEDINKYISKYKPNHVMMGPIHFEYVSNDKKKRDWSFLKNIVSGGDSMSLNLERDANIKLEKNKSNVRLEQGYGESECFGASACNHKDFIREGSVGIPHLLTDMAIFKVNDDDNDYTTDLELSFGERGEICISSPVVMKGYLNNNEATDLVLKKHSDGKIWLHTGDIGYIDEEGYIFITDRIKDLIFRNGFKVSPQKLNSTILQKFANEIETSVVIGVPDDIERNVPVVFFKIKDEYIEQEKELVSQISDYCELIFTDIEKPREAVVLESFPRTSAGKIDKKELKKNYIDEYNSSHNILIKKEKR